MHGGERLAITVVVTEIGLQNSLVMKSNAVKHNCSRVRRYSEA